MAILESAEDNYRNVCHPPTDTAPPALNPEVPRTARTSVQRQWARWDLQDAQARYASTPKGEADLCARLDALMAGSGRAPSSPYQGPTDDTTEKYDLARAITTGSRLRARAIEIGNDVRTGTLTSAQAGLLAVFPPSEVTIMRAGMTRWLELNTKDNDRHPSAAVTWAEPKHRGLKGLIHAIKLDVQHLKEADEYGA